MITSRSGWFLRIAITLCCILCVSIATLYAAGGSAVTDWANDTIIGTGYGVPPERAKNPGHARILAHQAAMLDAYRRLAEQAKGIHITASSTMEDNILSGDIVAGEVDAVIKRAKIVTGSEQYDGYGNCTLTLEVPLYGVTNSIAKVALKPVAKEAFPEPSVQGTDDAVDGGYTGLVIDCSDVVGSTSGSIVPVAFRGEMLLSNGGTGLNPVMKPMVRRDSGQAIYSYNNLDYEKVVEKGMVSYTDGKNGGSDRAGKKPLIVKAVKLDDNGSSPVVSARDADKILKENQASHFLDDGALVFMSTKGLRDSYSKPYRASANGATT